MKKNTTKSATSPAPATKPAPAAKTARPAAKKKAAAPAALVQAVAAKNHTTTITAQIDVGFGNQLHIRGEGPGLSWDKGLLMDCVAGDQWRVVLPESARPIVFKFLVNDLSWSAGDDYTVEPGSSLTLSPTF